MSYKFIEAEESSMEKKTENYISDQAIENKNSDDLDLVNFNRFKETLVCNLTIFVCFRPKIILMLK